MLYIYTIKSTYYCACRLTNVMSTDHFFKVLTSKVTTTGTTGGLKTKIYKINDKATTEVNIKNI